MGFHLPIYHSGAPKRKKSYSCQNDFKSQGKSRRLLLHWWCEETLLFTLLSFMCSFEKIAGLQDWMKTTIYSPKQFWYLARLPLALLGLYRMSFVIVLVISLWPKANGICWTEILYRYLIQGSKSVYNGQHTTSNRWCCAKRSITHGVEKSMKNEKKKCLGLGPIFSNNNARNSPGNVAFSTCHYKTSVLLSK